MYDKLNIGEETLATQIAQEILLLIAQIESIVLVYVVDVPEHALLCAKTLATNATLEHLLGVRLRMIVAHVIDETGVG